MIDHTETGLPPALVDAFIEETGRRIAQLKTNLDALHLDPKDARGRSSL